MCPCAVLYFCLYTLLYHILHHILYNPRSMTDEKFLYL
jgi:hypothetical protein